MKTFSLIAIIFFFIGTANANQDKWDTTDKMLSGTALALTMIDMGQTVSIAKDCRNNGAHYYETNNLLGKCPSVGRVREYFVSSILLSGVIADMLPSKYRKDFLAASAAIEFKAAYHNFSASVVWSWK